MLSFLTRDSAYGGIPFFVFVFNPDKSEFVLGGNGTQRKGIHLKKISVFR